MQRPALSCDANRLRLLLDDALPAPAHQEVVGHLDTCERCQHTLQELAADQGWWDELRQIDGFVTTTARATARTADRLTAAQPTPFPLDFLDPCDDAGALGRLDGFVVTDVLGQGGFGLVFKAQDQQLSRLVAIKVLAPCFACNGAARQRFAREAQAAATVVHPHVVPIYSVNAWKGIPYLVMSYIPGRPLQDRIERQGHLPVAEILRIGMQTASGLAAAHAQGLVHRDIKPANILLENDVGRVWLTDFGLARAADDASLTQSGVIAGTPQYMAPEQAQGLAVDHRCDLFSMGSTMYAMCTGHAPFRAEGAMAVLRRVCEDRPRSIREINPEIPAWLCGIIDRLLAKSPTDRYQSAAEVADLLGKSLAHVQQPTVHALPQELASISAGAVSRPRHRRWRMALLSALGLALAALALLVPWRDLLDPPSAAALPRPRSYIVDTMPPAGLSNGANKRTEPVLVVRPVESDSLEDRVAQMRSETNALMADFQGPSARVADDVIDGLLRRTQQQLDALERELTSPAPR